MFDINNLRDKGAISVHTSRGFRPHSLAAEMPVCGEAGHCGAGTCDKGLSIHFGQEAESKGDQEADLTFKSCFLQLGPTFISIQTFPQCAIS